MKCSTCYLHMKTKKLPDFQICICVPLIFLHSSELVITLLMKFSTFSLTKFRVLLSGCKKSDLKEIAAEISQILRGNSGGIYLDHLYSLIMYIHGTSLKRAPTIKKSPANYTLSITSYKRALELIRIPQILNHSDVIKTLPSNLQNRENILMVASRLVILLEINY